MRKSVVCKAWGEKNLLHYAEKLVSLMRLRFGEKENFQLLIGFCVKYFAVAKKKCNVWELFECFVTLSI
jgi:hypothetical protein